MLEGTTWRLTLSVGRESGTWMPTDWAASGARLSMPIEVTFTDEPIGVLPLGAVFLDRSREPAAREADMSDSKRVLSSPGRFIGAQGEVAVNVTAGAWATWPTGRCGEHRLRFYLDFGEGAQRNDVVIPEGRVYFDSACWDRDELLAAEADEASLGSELEWLLSESYEADLEAAEGGTTLLAQAQGARERFLREEQIRTLQWELSYLKRAMPGRARVGLLAAPGGVLLGDAGGLSIRAEGPESLWGLAGEVFFILGTFSVASANT
mgnify:CR=1 FL=1